MYKSRGICLLQVLPLCFESGVSDLLIFAKWDVKVGFSVTGIYEFVDNPIAFCNIRVAIAINEHDDSIVCVETPNGDSYRVSEITLVVDWPNDAFVRTSHNGNSFMRNSDATFECFVGEFADMIVVAPGDTIIFVVSRIRISGSFA